MVGSWDQYTQRTPLESSVLVKGEMRLVRCSWEKIKCVHKERVSITIINEVIITFELKEDLIL